MMSSTCMLYNFKANQIGHVHTSNNKKKKKTNNYEQNLKIKTNNECISLFLLFCSRHYSKHHISDEFTAAKPIEIQFYFKILFFNFLYCVVIILTIFNSLFS